MFELQWPWALLMLPLPWVLRWLLPAADPAPQAALRVPVIDDFDHDGGSAGMASLRPWTLLLLIVGWLLLVLATARPQWVGEQLQIPVSGRDLMLAVDLSGSMQVEDFSINGRTVNRLTATKHVAQDFIRARQGDRIGLILFGRRAYLQTPLTFDLQTVNTLLLESAIGLAGKETAIGDAIGLAVKRLQDSDGNRVLILLTDGANTAGEITPLKAAQLAAEKGLRIYTIGIGADEMIRNSFFGKQRINPSQELDEETLTAIADQTGGQYFRARDTRQLADIYRRLDQLEPVEVETQTLRPVRSLYIWPLAAAVLLGMLLAAANVIGRRGGP
ncbi:MAG: VWA domain-containing protein [Gammaproteobacteria bacterium]|nr:VWA domain-containing protein [Gammaproteobacteria bacterium]